MAVVPFNKFHQFAEDLGKKVHNLSADSFKLLLTNVAPVAANAVKADITEIAAGGGYAAGGIAVTVTSYEQVLGVATMILADAALTATAGGLATYRYVVLYNDTPSSPADPLVGWWDRGASVTLVEGDEFQFDADATNGVLQVS